MTPDQLEKMKQFFGIEDRLDLESIQLRKDIEGVQHLGTQGTIDTDLHFQSERMSTEINTNDFLNMSSDEEDN